MKRFLVALSASLLVMGMLFTPLSFAQDAPIGITPGAPAQPATQPASQPSAQPAAQPQNAGRTALPFGNQNYPGVDVNDSQVISQTGGAQGIVETVRNVFKSLMTLLGPVLVFLIAGLGIQLIIAGGNEEKFTAASRNFLYILVGTGIVVFADFLVETFSLYQGTPGSESTFISSTGDVVTATDRLRGQFDIVLRLLRYALGGIAVFYVVRAGSMILFNPEEENRFQAKRNFSVWFCGLIVIMISEALVRTVFSISAPSGALFGGDPVVTPQVDVDLGIGLLGNLTNLLLAGLASLFMFTLVVGGVMYAASAGNEERGQRATKIIIGSLLGLVIAFSSFTIVNEFATGGQSLAPQTQIEGGANPTPQPLSPPATN